MEGYCLGLRVARIWERPGVGAAWWTDRCMHCLSGLRSEASAKSLFVEGSVLRSMLLGGVLPLGDRLGRRKLGRLGTMLESV